MGLALRAWTILTSTNVRAVLRPASYDYTRRAKSTGRILLLVALAAAFPPIAALAQPQRDGRHDFDFEFGSWKAHLARRLHPLTGSNTWVTYEGTSVVRKIWNGRANLGEFNVRGSAGHIEGLSLRTYDPRSHQWNISWANSNDGLLGEPMIGEFKNGRGEFFDQEPFDGRAIFVRFIFSGITPNAFRLEQAFSQDGGKTWEADWIATFTRVSR